MPPQLLLLINSLPLRLKTKPNQNARLKPFKAPSPTKMYAVVVKKLPAFESTGIGINLSWAFTVASVQAVRSPEQ